MRQGGAYPRLKGGDGGRSKCQCILQRQSFLHAKVEIGLDVIEVLQHQGTGLCRILRLQCIEQVGMIVVAAA